MTVKGHNGSSCNIFKCVFQSLLIFTLLLKMKRVNNLANVAFIYCPSQNNVLMLVERK